MRLAGHGAAATARDCRAPHHTEEPESAHGPKHDKCRAGCLRSNSTASSDRRRLRRRSTTHTSRDGGPPTLPRTPSTARLRCVPLTITFLRPASVSPKLCASVPCGQPRLTTGRCEQPPVLSDGLMQSSAVLQTLRIDLLWRLLLSYLAPVVAAERVCAAEGRAAGAASWTAAGWRWRARCPAGAAAAAVL